MSGADTLARAPRLALRVGALGRELILLVFVATVTYLATEYVGVAWSPAQCDVSGVSEAVAGGAVLPAVIRRRFPATALLCAALLFGWYPATGVTLALAAYGAAARIRTVRWRRAALALAALVPFTVGVVWSEFQWKTAFVDFGIAALVCVAGPVAVQALLAQRERLIGALREQTRYLRANHQLAASAARLQERSRIAQEMHDLLGHRLSLISLYAGSLELDAAARQPQYAEPARLIRGTVRTAMDELRATLGMLRQREPAGSATKPTDEAGTWPDVCRLVRQAQAGGVRVELVWTGDDLVGTALPIRQAVHRIIRESLTNVYRHAAGATTKVVVEPCAYRVRVSVVDDGHPGGHEGMPGSGLGLVGVQERVRLLGGTFEAGQTPSGGFRVAAELPRSIAADAAVPAEPLTEPDESDSSPALIEDRWAPAGMSAVLATGLIGAVAVLVVTFNAVPFEVPGQVISFDSMALGTSRTSVAEYIGDDSPLARRAARGIESARPAAADCWYSSDFTDDGTTVIERYCFRQDLLVHKARFDVPDGQP